MNRTRRRSPSTSPSHSPGRDHQSASPEEASSSAAGSRSRTSNHSHSIDSRSRGAGGRFQSAIHTDTNEVRSCVRCRTTETPQWRTVDGDSLCNRCGVKGRRCAARARKKPKLEYLVNSRSTSPSEGIKSRKK